MSLEAMRTLIDVEEQLRQKKAGAAANAKRSLAETEAKGIQMLDEATARADAEIRQLLSAADRAAEERARTLADETEARTRSLRNSAEEKMAEALQFIIERVVNS